MAGVSPHRISLRLTARLLRLPLKGGVISEFFEVGLVDWRRDHLLGASSALSAAQHHSPPLRGSRQDKGEARSRAGGGYTPRPLREHQRHGQPGVGGGQSPILDSRVSIQ